MREPGDHHRYREERTVTKILAIMGSPHKGNSLQATQRIEESLARFGDVEFDYVHPDTGAGKLVL